MPFPIVVFGFPDETSVETLRGIRANIITKLAEATGISPQIIRPFFPTDRLGDPDPGQDTTIYCVLDTGMFVEKSKEERKKATSAIAEVIWRAFSGKIEVEVYIGDLNGAGKTLRRPASTRFTFEEAAWEAVYVRTVDQVGGDVREFVIDVQIGEQMQWAAEPESDLVFAEVCFPPYEDGRYENIE